MYSEDPNDPSVMLRQMRESIKLHDERVGTRRGGAAYDMVAYWADRLDKHITKTGELPDEWAKK